MRTYVFYSDYGKNLVASNTREFHWKPLLKRVGVPYKVLYSTRHTFTTTMLSSGKFTLNQIASMLEHSNINTLIKYYNKFIESENDKIHTDFDVFCQNNSQNISQVA